MFKLILSSRVGRIKPSPTLAVTSRARALKAQGHDIIDLGVGEPDFDTPDFIKEAAIGAIHAGFTKYTAVDGMPSLKDAVVRKFATENRLDFTTSQVLVSVGGKQSFYNLAQALLDPEDEVVIPAPYWVSYLDIVLIADGLPVVIPTTFEQGYKVTPEALDAAMTYKTKLVVLNSPSNPTGAVYTAAELAALGEVLRRYPHALIATDDMYEHISWGSEPFCNIVNVCPDLLERTIVLNGVSKAYAMTGWRIGYAAGPAELIAAMTKVQSQSTSNPASIAQVAAEAALRGGTGCVVPMRQAFRERHDWLIEHLNALPGVRCRPAQGTFYLFPEVTGVLRSLELADDQALTERLLDEAGVALVPGAAFGAPGHVRFSYATSLPVLQAALQRISRFLAGERSTAVRA
ncbi:MAG: pyridoxal phosphate-dependent aminotransferase [Gammaproteobacteria bacterium]|nr:pyridoxal phosphate-dependent aminotransferase [Gammaproteobacteria bacterium]